VTDVMLLTLKSLGSCLRRSDELIFITTLTFSVLIFTLCLCAFASKYFILDAEARRRRVFISHSCVGRNPVTDVVLLTSKSLGSCLRRSDELIFDNHFNFLCFNFSSVPLWLCVEIFYFDAKAQRKIKKKVKVVKRNDETNPKHPIKKTHPQNQ